MTNWTAAREIRAIPGHRAHRWNRRFGGYYVLTGPDHTTRGGPYYLICQAHGQSQEVAKIAEALDRLGTGDWCGRCVGKMSEEALAKRLDEVWGPPIFGKTP